MDVVNIGNKDDATIAVAGMLHQDTDPDLKDIPDFIRTRFHS